MKKFLIFGTSDFAEVLFETISQDSPEIEVVGFVLDDAFCNEEFFCDRPVYKYSELKNKFSAEEVEILICIGYGNMNKNREKIFHKVQKDGWKIASYISKKAIVRTKDMGIGNIILDGVYIGIKCKLGDGNILYFSSILAHHSSVENFNFFACNVVVAGQVDIGNYCFFGNNSSTKDNIKIADECLIGAACHVGKDITVEGKVLIAPKMRTVEVSSAEVSAYLMQKIDSREGGMTF